MVLSFEKMFLLAGICFMAILPLLAFLKVATARSEGVPLEAAVGQVRALLAQGRAAMKSQDTAAMSEVSRLIERLVSAGPA